MSEKENNVQADAVVVPEEVEKEKMDVSEEEGKERVASPEREKKRFFYSRKVCRFCTGQIKLEEVTYKNVDLLRRYVMPSGKIVPRRITGTCAKHQRRITEEIKKARILAFLPVLAR